MRITYFNPRLREGGDRIDFDYFQNASKISIHASAKEATVSGGVETHIDAIFNPRLREGGDSYNH